MKKRGITNRSKTAAMIMKRARKLKLASSLSFSWLVNVRTVLDNLSQMYKLVGDISSGNSSAARSIGAAKHSLRFAPSFVFRLYSLKTTMKSNFQFSNSLTHRVTRHSLSLSVNRGPQVFERFKKKKKKVYRAYMQFLIQYLHKVFLNIYM